MSRVLLLLDHRENRRLLMEALMARYDISAPETDEALASAYDLCIIDGPALERLWQQVEARKGAESPIFLPFLLVTARPDVGLATRHLWHGIDELITTPIERVELQARVEILLRARQASVHNANERIAFARQAREVTGIVENIDTAVMITDHDGRILRANTALARMVRHPLHTLVGKTFAELTGLIFDVPWRQRAWEKRKTTKRHGVSITFPFAPERGTTYWDVVVTPIILPDHQVSSILTAYSEVSEYVIARQAVEEERAGLRTILDTLPVGVFIVDVAGGIISANDACRRVWGGPIPAVHHVREYHLFKGWHPGSHLPLQPEEWAAARALTTGITTLDEEIDIERFDGTRGTILNSATPLRDDADHITGAIWVTQDISERKRSETEREQLLAEMDATFNSVADGLVVFDPAGHLVRINQAVARMFQFREKDLHKPLDEIIARLTIETPDGHPFPLDDLPVMHALRGERIFNVILVVQFHHQPPVWLSSSAAPIRTEDGGMLGVVVSFTDISAVHALQEQQKSLLQMVSHDLRAPLAVIKGYAQVIAEVIAERGLNGMLKQSLTAIDRGVNRLDTMIEDLVDVTRWEGGQLVLKREAVHLPRYLADLLERMRLALDTARIQVDVPADLPPVSADYARLERILVNLLSNALKYSDPDTAVRVKAHARDGEVVMAISDQGTGIPPEVIPHLFERFYRAADEHKTEGLGLGLYITKVLVEAHEGQLWVESEVGKGSTFFFSLPLSA